ncbi:MAG TPA: hypothetical protein VHF22_02380, partial [Planctomycetota bacterium]|nr:hypothetical protein [Planctomycetota bacterium]
MRSIAIWICSRSSFPPKGEKTFTSAPVVRSKLAAPAYSARPRATHVIERSSDFRSAGSGRTIPEGRAAAPGKRRSTSRWTTGTAELPPVMSTRETLVAWSRMRPRKLATAARIS